MPETKAKNSLTHMFMIRPFKFKDGHVNTGESPHVKEKRHQKVYA